MAVELIVEGDAFLDPDGILVELSAAGGEERSAIVTWGDLIEETFDNYCDETTGYPCSQKDRETLTKIADRLQSAAAVLRMAAGA